MMPSVQNILLLYFPPIRIRVNLQVVVNSWLVAIFLYFHRCLFPFMTVHVLSFATWCDFPLMPYSMTFVLLVFVHVGLCFPLSACLARCL